MAEAAPRISRRIAIAGSVALPVVPGAALSEHSPFLAWERELAELEVLPSDGLTDAQLDLACDRCGALMDLILKTPSKSIVASQVKLRCLIRQADKFDTWWSMPLRHVLASLS